MACEEVLLSVQADLLLVMGSSLKVQPVSLVPSELKLFVLISMCVTHFLIHKYPLSLSYRHPAPLHSNPAPSVVPLP